MGKGLKGDFTSFSFKGIDSSDLGITRVSDGSRYTDDLLPTSQDKTAVIPGGDGTYYWETNHTQKVFNIPIAFDNLSEEQYKRLRQVFNTKELGELKFAETDYKYYMAKPTGIPQLKTVCFEEEYYDEVDKENKKRRIYKGEGTIQFTAYYPYAKGNKVKIDEYGNDTTPITKIELINSGDLETDFQLFLSFSDGYNGADVIKSITLTNEKGTTIGKLDFSNGITNLKPNYDGGIRINSKTNLIEGYAKNTAGDTIIHNRIYNKFITAGDFFKIPIGKSFLTFSTVNGGKVKWCYLTYDQIYY
jgi:hypothetical protein